MVEQLGPRLINFRAPDSEHDRFVPSAFNLVLIYLGREDKNKCQIIQTVYGDEFKLTLNVTDAKINRGRYLIMVQPDWHESASFELGYRQVRTAIYSHQTI